MFRVKGKIGDESTPSGFSAQVWGIFGEVFIKNGENVLKTEFYPCLDPSKSYYYEMFRIYLDEKFFVELRSYSDHDEFFCEKPHYFWNCNRKRNIKGYYGPMTHFDNKEVKKMEQDLVMKFNQMDAQSILLMANRSEKNVYIGEFRTSNIDAVREFLKGI